MLPRTPPQGRGLALTHAVHAHHAFAAGDVQAHHDACGRAADALAAVADVEDRRIVAGTFAHAPAP